MSKKSNLIKKLEKETDMPPISLTDTSFIEITGNNHIELDGIKRIIESNKDIIKILFKKEVITFSGYNLLIRNFSGKTAIIEGDISNISFSSQGESIC